ncbi:MAG: HAMP domain-containing protein [Candidatus Omnitrophica bacterium]|nr:HAMP domain-containing protein [Candidatus Omnitrophota bacterium]
MKMGLQAKMGITFSALFIIGSITTGTIAYENNKRILEDCAFKRLHCRAKAIQCRIKGFCCERQTDIKSKATSIYIRKRLKGLIEQAQNPKILIKEITISLKQMIRDDPRIIELFILNCQGEIIASTDETQIGEDKSDRVYFLKGCKFITGCTEIYYSPVFKIPTVLIFTPIVEEKTGNLLGIGVMRISFEELSRIIIEECALLKDEEVYVLDRNGRFAFGSIAHTVSLGEKLHSKAIKNCLTSKTDIKCKCMNYKDVPVISECRWLPERQCTLIVELAEREAFAFIYKIRNWFFAIVAILTFVIVNVTIVFAKHLSLPILKLKEAVDKIALGDLGVTVDVRGKDEIGALAESFNRMAKDLKGYRQKLQEWGETLEQKVREKTKELRKKVEELEEFNKLAVGRELKMIELKKEIEDLKKRLKGN